MANELPDGQEPSFDSGHPTSEDWERITDRIAAWDRTNQEAESS